MTDSHWQDMFERRSRGGGRSPTGAPPPMQRDTPDDDPPGIDLADYRPWVLQRGRSRPTMLLDLRRFEPRSGMWTGWALSYPSLVAAEYVGERMLSLDFGMRQFMIEGDGLSELMAQLQLGTVISVLEYNATIWPHRSPGPLVASIRRLGGKEVGM